MITNVELVVGLRANQVQIQAFWL